MKNRIYLALGVLLLLGSFAFVYKLSSDNNKFKSEMVLLKKEEKKLVGDIEKIKKRKEITPQSINDNREKVNQIGNDIISYQKEYSDYEATYDAVVDKKNIKNIANKLKTRIDGKGYTPWFEGFNWTFVNPYFGSNKSLLFLNFTDDNKLCALTTANYKEGTDKFEKVNVRITKYGLSLTDPTLSDPNMDFDVMVNKIEENVDTSGDGLTDEERNQVYEIRDKMKGVMDDEI